MKGRTRMPLIRACKKCLILLGFCDRRGNPSRSAKSAAQVIAEPAAPLQERFWQKHVDPLVAVDELRHAQVAGERAQHVSLVASEIGARADVLDHFSDGLLGRVIEILVKAN